MMAGMAYCSTRGETPASDAAQALLAGAAPDGGLFMPQRWPHTPPDAFDGLSALPDIAARLLGPFFAGSSLSASLEEICTQTLDLPAPLVRLEAGDRDVRMLELFHGPTGAFKDFGARFLMAALKQLAPDAPPVILAATSGDTGGAVGAAAEAAGLPALLLYPKGRVSAFQEHQLCCWRLPVRAARVAGDFDACQALVKSAFADPELRDRHRLSSANSINFGRLAPQMAYWAKAALEAWRETGNPPGLIIPTGNLGDAVAALMARACGLPIGPVVLSTNANATLADWRRTGRYRGRASIPTLANAMDVGAPSNFERLEALDRAGDGAAKIARVERVEDEDISGEIAKSWREWGYIACPHSATGLAAWRRLPENDRDGRSWIIAATAHPFKFADSVEPILGERIRPPPALQAVLGREARPVDIGPDLTALSRLLAG